MTFLPIVDRELRVRARWRSTYLIRVAIAVLAIAVTIVMLFFAAVSARSVGKEMLMVLGWLTFLFCTIEGFRSTADSLSEEKREGTLGLLFLTDLRGFDVVLGKFAGSSLSSFYGLLATVPALAITLLLGGVTGAEFWRVVLSLLNALFFSLSAGMFVSALSRDERKAWGATVALVAFAVVALPLLARATHWHAFGAFSPTAAFVASFDQSYSANPRRYWWSVAGVQMVSWGCLVAASVLLPRSWQDSGQEQRRRRSRVQSPAELRRKSAVLTVNPVWWLTARNDKQRALWITVYTAIALGIAGFALGGGDGGVGWILFFCGVALHFAINVWVASEACYSFADARSSGAMELLLSTPLTVRQIVLGQQLAIKDFFFRPVVVLLIGEGAIAVVQMVLLAARGEQGAAIGVFFMVGITIAWLLLDLFAVTRVGMWFGMNSASPTQALTKTILYVLVLPMLIAPCCNVISVGLLLAKSAILFTWAQNKLEKEFRAAATRRFEGTRTEWWKAPGPPKLTMPPG